GAIPLREPPACRRSQHSHPHADPPSFRYPARTGRRTSLPGAPSGYTQSWSFQAPMYMVASADTLISSNAGGFQTHRLGRGTTVFRAMAVTSFPAGFGGRVPWVHAAAWSWETEPRR